MSQTLPRPPAAALYDQDLYGWALEQAEALRTGRLSALDLANLAEEIDDVGREQLDKLESALRLILMHMLKWDQQPERRTRSWTITIAVQRLEYGKTMRRNPGLRSRRNEALRDAYRRARLEAADETGLPRSRFPTECPYGLDDVLERPVEWPDP